MLISVCLFFFFSSRRRHTRFDCDWSSDVCSSDLRYGELLDEVGDAGHPIVRDLQALLERRSEERRVGKGVDLGGRRIIKKKKKIKKWRERTVLNTHHRKTHSALE